MAKWSKSKAQTEMKLPPLTTDQEQTTPDWHKIKMVEKLDPAALWTVTWDTSRQSALFNTAYQKTEAEATDCAKRFLRLGFVVYSIRDPSGTEVMDETAIATRFKPELPPAKSWRAPPRDGATD
jgi:hypothetical protein